MNKLARIQPYLYVDVLGVAFPKQTRDTSWQAPLSRVKARWEVFQGNHRDGLSGRDLVPSANELVAAYGALVDGISASYSMDEERSRLVRCGVDLANVILAGLEDARLDGARERLAARAHAFLQSEIARKPGGYIDRIFLNLQFFQWIKQHDLLAELTDRWEHHDPDDLSYPFPDDVMENFARNVRHISALQDESRQAHGFCGDGRYFMRHPLKDSMAADYFWAFVRVPQPVKDVAGIGRLNAGPRPA